MRNRLYELLMCPGCGASPVPGSERCPGCNRSLRALNGGLDLLDDDLRSDADTFAGQYQELRRREGWSSATGREDPIDGDQRLWKGRLRSVSEAAAFLAHEWPAGSRPVVADIGSGGGWAARLLPSADVLAFDMLDASPNTAAVTIRADMRKLPVRSATLDAVLFAASLHYAAVEAAVSEAARVLRPRGLMVAVDSPIYKDAASQARAVARTAAYYSHAGHPGLSDHYHPINAPALRSALVSSGFQVERLSIQGNAFERWRGLARRAPAAIVVARRLAGRGYARRP
jgi:SAM-dependent methyltransferase